MPTPAPAAATSAPMRRSRGPAPARARMGRRHGVHGGSVEGDLGREQQQRPGEDARHPAHHAPGHRCEEPELDRRAASGNDQQPDADGDGQRGRQGCVASAATATSPAAVRTIRPRSGRRGRPRVRERRDALSPRSSSSRVSASTSAFAGRARRGIRRTSFQGRSRPRRACSSVPSASWCAAMNMSSESTTSALRSSSLGLARRSGRAGGRGDACRVCGVRESQRHGSWPHVAAEQ